MFGVFSKGLLFFLIDLLMSGIFSNKIFFFFMDLFMFGAFSSKLLFFPVGLFIFDTFFGGLLLFPMNLLMSDILSSRFFHVKYYLIRFLSSKTIQIILANISAYFFLIYKYFNLVYE